ncbi:MAG TPA: carboxypeptidase-like regulatory domain-containing protein [Terriglobia bacterium]|nr:carboxypeptidase-like regulatory domain-containing protein [Terriglobia bacterium]
MGRFSSLGTALSDLLLLSVMSAAPLVAQTSVGEAPKLLISVEQPRITAPFPVRVTLHLHNSGQTPLWLYRHARDPNAAGVSPAQRIEPEENGSSTTTGGSTLTIRLDPVEAGGNATPAQGRALESVGMPHPKLVKLAPGDDYEEKAVIHVAPALAGTGTSAKPVWGRYRLSITYGATFSNGDEFARDLSLTVWQGEVTSNTIEVELAPPQGTGSVAGATVSPDMRPISGILVSLSDNDERLIDQVFSDTEGRFSFTQLPLGLYWATARRPDAQEDTVVFRHVELTSAAPAGTVELPLLPTEVYEPKQMLHKPVLIRVTGSAGGPVDKVELELTWSSGTVLDNVKAETDADGAAAVELIPGRSYVSLKRRGCAKLDQWIDVAPGDGIDDGKLTFDCARK